MHNNTVAQAADRILPLFSLKGRTAIVTGAASGIGHAVVQALAESGANVAFTYNSNKDKAIEGAKAIEETYNVQCEFICVRVLYSPRLRFVFFSNW